MNFFIELMLILWTNLVFGSTIEMILYIDLSIID